MFAGANPKEIIFTSGATESNNIAVKGVAKFYRKRKQHVITAATEHKCVLDSCRYLEKEGFEVSDSISCIFNGFNHHNVIFCAYKLYRGISDIAVMYKVSYV